MPFTFAHPAVVVPLVRPLGRYGVLSALVIGSLAPDFSYFLPLPITRSRSHDLYGLLWFCMPTGIAGYALFHGLLASPGIDLLPAALRARCRVVAASRARPAVRAILVSLFAGALTHIAWDAFTHAGAPIVRVSRALRFHLATISGYPVSVYTILQHVSTAAGLVLLVVWVRRWQRSAPATPVAPGFSMGSGARLAAIVAIAVVALGFWIASDRIVPPKGATLRELQLLLRRAVPPAVSSLALALGLYAVAWQLMVHRAGGRSNRC